MQTTSSRRDSIDSSLNRSSICNYDTPQSSVQEGAAVEQDFNMLSNSYETFHYRDEAIPFITITDGSNSSQKQFEVNPEAVKLLESIQGEFGVVTIAGPYRTGKSSLVGRALLNNPKAFQAGATVNACTKGLWIYARPITDCRTPSGEQISAVVIDSEGLNAIDESQNHDLRILTLSLLLSSKLIYNSLNAIDEQSLSQLNLVVNLTKHIKLRSCQFSDEQDPEELAKIFPAFLWLVRDFNLALVDQEGAPITQKEYLELALQEQAGMSERTEVKNRTRRLFKSLFDERDCQTFDRPVADEKKLQNLSEIADEDLKPSFQRQLEVLRKKVLGKMKAKKLHGKSITGRVLVNLAHQYVQAFNSGQAPNIENAWTYICRNENSKALALARSHFRTVFEQGLKLPCALSSLTFQYKESKRGAMKVYRERAIVDSDSTGEQNVLKECKDLLEVTKVRNDQACTLACTQLLNQYHSEIMSSLATKLQEEENKDESPIFTNLLQVEAALQQIEISFEQQGPEGEDYLRKLIFEKFRSQISFEASHHFLRLTQQEAKVNSEVLRERGDRTQKEVTQVRKEMSGEIEKVREQFKVKDRESCDFEAKNKIMHEQISGIEASSQQSIIELKEQQEKEKRKLVDQSSEAKCGQELAEAELARISRQMMELSSTAEKEKALLQQEIDNFKRTDSDLRRRETDLGEEINQIKMATFDERKERESALQTALNEALTEVQVATEKSQDLTEQLDLSHQKLEDSRQNFALKQKELEEKLNETAQQLAQNSHKVTDSQQKLEESLVEAQTKLQEALESAKEQFESHQTKLQSLSHEKDTIIAQQEKEQAVLRQNESHLTQKASQLQDQLEKSKVEAQELLSQLQKKADESAKGAASEQKALLDSLQKSHSEERESLLEQHQSEKTQLEDELEKVKQSLDEVSLTTKVEGVELQKSVQNLTEQVESLEEEKDRLSKQLKAQKDRNELILETMESKSSQSVANLTREHEAQIAELEQTLNESQEQAKSELAKLKITFEKEKEQVTQMAQYSKAAGKEMEQQIREEYEQRISEDEQKFDEERTFLQGQLSQLKFESQAKVDLLERDNMLLRNEHENLASISSERLTQLKGLEETCENRLKNSLRSHSEELGKLQDKIDSLTVALTQREQALITVNLNLQHTQVDLTRRKTQLDSLEETQRADIVKLEDKISSLRDENQQLKDDLQGKNMDYSRDSALNEQSIEFLRRKVTEQQTLAEQRTRELEDQLAFIKADKSQQLVDQASFFAQTKTELETKFEQKRKALKQLQADYQQKVSEQDRKTIVLNQQLSSLQMQVAEAQLGYEAQIQRLNEQLDIAQEQSSMELRSVYEKADSFKLRVQELEKENQSHLSEIEKDRALFEDKVKFLTEQRSRLESEKADIDRRLKEEQENLQKTRSLEKEKATKSRQECVTHLETYYKQMIQRLSEESKKVQEESASRAKALQESVQQLTTQLEIAKREKDQVTKSSSSQLDKADKVESQLRQDLTALKQQHEDAVVDYQNKLEQLRESTKTKISQSDKERKEIELSQTSLRHNSQIEVAKWSLKSEQYQNEIRQLNEEVERVQKKYQTLLRENQKLRTSHRAQMQSSANYSSNRSSSFMNTMTLSSNALKQFSNSLKQANATTTATSTESGNAENESVASTKQSGFHHLRSNSSAAMTKVATFSAKQSKGGSTLLSQQIKQSMAKCSPKRLNEKRPVYTGAAGLLKSHNLSKSPLSVVSTNVMGAQNQNQRDQMPFKAQDNFQKAFQSSPSGKKAKKTNEENQLPLIPFDDYEEAAAKEQNFNSKMAVMTIDELMAPHEQ